MNEEPTHDQLISAIMDWQRGEHNHPFTCGFDASHPPLVPLEREDCIELWCPRWMCPWMQVVTPDLAHILWNYVKLHQRAI